MNETFRPMAPQPDWDVIYPEVMRWVPDADLAHAALLRLCERLQAGYIVRNPTGWCIKTAHDLYVNQRRHAAVERGYLEAVST